MTGDKSRLLKPFDRVCWQNDPADQGTVIEKNWSGVTIKWDSRGEQAIFTTTWPELSVCRRNWCEGGVLPISGKRAAKQEAKKADKPAAARSRKRA